MKYLDHNLPSFINSSITSLRSWPVHGKNGFVTAAKLGTADNFFVAATKNFAAATKRFVDRTKHFVVVTKNVVIPIFTNDFVRITKPFSRVNFESLRARRKLTMWVSRSLIG